MLLSKILLPLPLLLSLPHAVIALVGSRHGDSLIHSTGLQQNDQAPLGPGVDMESPSANNPNKEDPPDDDPPIVQFQLVHSFTPANSKYVQVFNGSYSVDPIRFNPSDGGYMRANFTLDTATGIISHWINKTEHQLMVHANEEHFDSQPLTVWSVNTSETRLLDAYEPLPCTIDRSSRNLECVVEHRVGMFDRFMTTDDTGGDGGVQIVVLTDRNADLDDTFHACTIKAVPPPKREPDPWNPPREPGRPPRRVVTLDEWLGDESTDDWVLL